MIETYTADEVEAALCIWEYCMLRRNQEDDNVFDWLRGGEGTASARQQCIELARDCEKSYHIARSHGYDTLFDWEFVPRWVQLAMSVNRSSVLTPDWITYIGLEIYREFRLEY
jgi:hypothetical protein